MSTERDMIAGEDDASLFADAMGHGQPEEVVETEAPKAEVETELGQPRDDKGRFAPKAGEAEEQPLLAEEPQRMAEREDARIPSYRLKEEAEARRAEKERADRLEAMVMELVRQRQQPMQPQQNLPPPDWLDAPDQFVDYHVDQKVSPQIQRTMQIAMYNAKLIAGVVHGQDVVTQAEQAFNEAARTGMIDPAIHERINNSPNPFDAAVDWWKREQTLKEVGTDPKSYREKVLAEAMADPEFVARVIAAQRSGGAAPAAKQTNITRLPPSLVKSNGAAASRAEDQYDDSDAGLLRSALSRR